MLKYLLYTTLFTALIGLAYAWKPMGKNPNEQLLSSFGESSNFDPAKLEFKNEKFDALADLKKKSFKYDTVKEWMFPTKATKPDKALPFETPNFNEFIDSTGAAKAIWFGHSTILLSMEKVNILIDPVFSPSASPFPFLFKRFQAPIVPIYELPQIDVIVISHDHYDHLDYETIQQFAGTGTRFIVPLGVDSHLIYWGVNKDNIVALDWSEQIVFKKIKFTATPSQHYSGRNGAQNNKTLWASWVIQSNSKSIFFSGDSGYNEHFKHIGQEYGPFDVAFIETGQYGEDWKSVHLMPEESALAGYNLNTKVHFPIHWGMFDLSTHAWDEPIKLITEHCLKYDFNLAEPYLGKIYTF